MLCTRAILPELTTSAESDEPQEVLLMNHMSSCSQAIHTSVTCLVHLDTTSA